ncbi:Protein of unknown function [Pyronema omphalodes CBS 100304]|uniref:Uncharacterized protein n=1 Tax=Pyronema omphalodes (strain CBS 100304) TaxID=1076935 RepID=U4LJ96_PYROM|nr:Protein of unknown function [Pyronema omphalodes CBS 100304]
MSHPELVLLHRFASSATTTMALYGLKIQPPQQLRRLKRHASSTLAKTRDSSRDPTATESKGMIEDPDIASYWLLFFCIRIPRISKSTKQKQPSTRNPTEYSPSSSLSRASNIRGYYDNARSGEQMVISRFRMSDYEVPLTSSATKHKFRQDIRLDSVQSNKTVYYPAEEGQDSSEEG